MYIHTAFGTFNQGIENDKSKIFSNKHGLYKMSFWSLQTYVFAVM